MINCNNTCEFCPEFIERRREISEAMAEVATLKVTNIDLRKHEENIVEATKVPGAPDMGKLDAELFPLAQGLILPSRMRLSVIRDRVISGLKLIELQKADIISTEESVQHLLRGCDTGPSVKRRFGIFGKKIVSCASRNI